MKKILAMILALTMILSLAACGAGEAPATDPVPVETQPQVTEPVVQEPQKNVDRYPLQSDKTFDVVAGSDIFGDDGVYGWSAGSDRSGL